MCIGIPSHSRIITLAPTGRHIIAQGNALCYLTHSQIPVKYRGDENKERMPTTLIYHDVPIEMTRKAVKYLRLRVTPTGAVHLSVPWHCPQSLVDIFLAQQWPWVEAQRAKLQTQITPPAISADSVVLFGVRYPIAVVVQTTRQVIIDADRIVLHHTARDGAPAQQRLLQQFLQAQLATQLTSFVSQWHHTMQTVVPTWQIRNMRSRWGSCNPRTAHLAFALALVHQPLPCIEYVVIHELAHLFEANHGPKFWQIVTTHCPHWREFRQQMRMS
jgi:predicted metal-dependent hydrolase